MESEGNKSNKRENFDDLPELLFFDTFTHDNNPNELNLDLVQFSYPVSVSEIRVIPLGAKVQADFPGGVRLGATNPSHFSVEFFINDISSPGSCSFQNIGSLNYNQNGPIHIECERKNIPTDGLIVRGRYTTITLAVYGFISKFKPNDKKKQKKEKMRFDENSATAEWVEQHAHVPNEEIFDIDVGSDEKCWPYDDQKDDKDSIDKEIVEVIPEGLTIVSEELTAVSEEITTVAEDTVIPTEDEKCDKIEANENVDVISSEVVEENKMQSPIKECVAKSAADDMEPISDEEMECENDDEEEEPEKQEEQVEIINEVEATPSMGQVEPILSGSSEDELEYDLHVNEDIDVTIVPDDPVKMFDPFSFQATALQYMRNPCMSEFEWNITRIAANGDISESSSSVLLNNASEEYFVENKQKWVHSVEGVILTLSEELAQCLDRDRYSKPLCDLVKIGLNLEFAKSQLKPSLKIRHLKVGLNLCECLCNLGENMIVKLIEEVDIQNRVMSIVDKEEYMAISLKLIALRILDASLRYVKTTQMFLNHNGYEKLLNLLQTNKSIRIKYCLTNLLRKMHLYELMENLTSEEKSENVEIYLQELMEYLKNAPYWLSQPNKYLPGSSRFEFNTNFPDPYSTIFTYFRDFNLHWKLLSLLKTVDIIDKSLILDLIEKLMETNDGMKYFLSNPESINDIVKHLFESQNEMLGLRLIHKLQAMISIDVLQGLIASSALIIDYDSPKLKDTLDMLYSYTFSSIGNEALATTLTKSNNIDPLLKIIENGTRKKHPSKSYAADLLNAVLTYNTDCRFLQIYSGKMIEICNNHREHVEELEKVEKWLNPIKDIGIITWKDNVKDLCQLLRKYSNNVISVQNELITVLRLLKYFGDDEAEADDVDDEDYESNQQLKYKYVLIQLYTNDGYSSLLNIIKNISCNYVKNQSIPITGQQSILLIFLLSPTIKLISKLLSYLMKCNSNFKDTSYINPLITLYCVVFNLLPSNSIQSILKQIIKSLLSFTYLPSAASDATINQSLWSKVLQQTFEFSITSPNVFIPCLIIISQLLPVQLPMSILSDLSECEIKQVKLCRQIWCAHALPSEGMIQKMIQTLSQSSYQPVLHLLKKVCIQLADLGYNVATTVVNTILNSLYPNLVAGIFNREEFKILNFLSHLTSYPAIKAALLSSTIKTAKNDEFNEFWINICKILENLDHQYQRCIISLMQSICDARISLLHENNEKFLSNSLPCKSIMITLCPTMLKFIGNKNSHLSNVAEILKVFITLTDYDYGFFHLKSAIDKCPDCLWNLLERLSKNWTKTDDDYVATLSILLEFFRLLCLPSRKDEEVIKTPSRTLFISSQELAIIIKWHAESDNPLEELKEKLNADDEKDEILTILSDNLTSLIKIVKESDSNGQFQPIIESKLPAPDSLKDQFEMRAIYVIDDAITDRLSESCFSFNVDDVDDEPSDQVSCDLTEIFNTLYPDIDLQDHLRNAYTNMDTTKTSPEGKDETQIKAECIDNRRINQGMISQIRRVAVNNSVQQLPRTDLFRSRVPNSSRAPSLHVDEFVALETRDQNKGNTYNKPHVRPVMNTPPAANRNKSRMFFHERTGMIPGFYRPTNAGFGWPVPGMRIPPTHPTAPPPPMPIMMRPADPMMRYPTMMRWPSMLPVRPPHLPIPPRFIPAPFPARMP